MESERAGRVCVPEAQSNEFADFLALRNGTGEEEKDGASDGEVLVGGVGSSGAQSEAEGGDERGSEWIGARVVLGLQLREPREERSEPVGSGGEGGDEGRRVSGGEEADFVAGGDSETAVEEAGDGETEHPQPRGRPVPVLRLWPRIHHRVAPLCRYLLCHLLSYSSSPSTPLLILYGACRLPRPLLST